jgi:hypothetical protein
MDCVGDILNKLTVKDLCVMLDSKLHFDRLHIDHGYSHALKQPRLIHFITHFSSLDSLIYI